MTIPVVTARPHGRGGAVERADDQRCGLAGWQGVRDRLHGDPGADEAVGVVLGVEAVEDLLGRMRLTVGGPLAVAVKLHLDGCVQAEDQRVRPDTRVDQVERVPPGEVHGWRCAAAGQLDQDVGRRAGQDRCQDSGADATEPLIEQVAVAEQKPPVAIRVIVVRVGGVSVFELEQQFLVAQAQGSVARVAQPGQAGGEQGRLAGGCPACDPHHGRHPTRPPTPAGAVGTAVSMGRSSGSRKPIWRR